MKRAERAGVLKKDRATSPLEIGEIAVRRLPDLSIVALPKELEEVTEISEQNELDELLAKHPESKLLVEKINEKLALTAKSSWLKEGLNTQDEPTMKFPVINETTEKMLVFLEEKGVITKEMAKEGKTNLAGTVYLKLSNESDIRTRQPDYSIRQLVSGENEQLALDIIKIKSRMFIEAQKSEPKAE